MEQKNNIKIKGFIIILLSIVVLVLMFSVLLTIPKFMEKYSTCEDDFRVIEYCGCLPYEGNYEYFAKQSGFDDYVKVRELYHAGK